MYARSSTISDVYNILLDKYNCRVESWWPVTTSKKQDREFEIIIGVILTQNTNWNNVVKSIKNLKKHDLISIEKIKNIDIKRLEELIRPSGFSITGRKHTLFLRLKGRPQSSKKG